MFATSRGYVRMSTYGCMDGAMYVRSTCSVVVALKSSQFMRLSPAQPIGAGRHHRRCTVASCPGAIPPTIADASIHTPSLGR